jgi:hypothetical protein
VPNRRDRRTAEPDVSWQVGDTGLDPMTSTV